MRIKSAGCVSPGGIPISWTERKCGHVSTTHNTAAVVSMALYKTRRGSQYRKASATECLKSSTLTGYHTTRHRQVLCNAKSKRKGPTPENRRAAAFAPAHSRFSLRPRFAKAGRTLRHRLNGESPLVSLNQLVAEFSFCTPSAPPLTYTFKLHIRNSGEATPMGRA